MIFDTFRGASAFEFCLSVPFKNSQFVQKLGLNKNGVIKKREVFSKSRRNFEKLGREPTDT